MQTKILIPQFLTAFLFFIGSPGYSQTIIPRFESLGVNDGLPHSSVYSITQDKKGFMWFGTPDGLCRYDGSSLQGYKYSSENPSDIVNNFVRGRMLEDKAGNIWYTNESGIYRWDIYSEKVIKARAFINNEFGNAAFKSVIIDENGSLWLMNLLSGIFEFDPVSGKLKQYPWPYTIDQSTVLLTYNVVDTAGNIWIRIVSKQDPYIVFNKTTHTYSTQLAGDPPHAIFFSKEIEVQAFEDRLVYRNLNSNHSRTVMKSIDDKEVSFYSFDGARDSYDRLWMTARGNGLFYYDERNDRFHEYHHNNSKIKSLPFDLTTCLFIDRSQNLWIGMDGGGVAKLDLKQPRFSLFPLSEGDFPVLNDYFTKCFYEDEKGRIWFGSQNNGLCILDNKTNKLINYHYEKNNPNSLPGNMLASILKDREGNMWIGSSGGISLFDEKKESFKTIIIHHLPKLHPQVNIFVFKIIQLKSGDLLAATLLGLVKIVKQENGNFEGYYFSDIPFLSSSTTDITETPGGNIYLTIPGYGLCELKPAGTGYSPVNIYLSGLDLRSVRMDERDSLMLWVSTGIGLVHFNTNTKKYTTLNEKDGMSNSYVYGSLEDSTGDLWISTNGGLSYLKRNSSLVENYTYQDGLQSNEFNTQAFYKSPTGVFYFGGIKGFNWFRPGPMSNVHTKPQAAITRVEISGQVFQRDSGFLLNHTITVPYFKNEFNFQFAALDYTRPEANKVQYMLQGWDGGWITGSAKSVRYANLYPGKYSLRMKVSNADGTWSDEQIIFIVIQAPFWKQTWFLIIAVLLTLFIAVLITYRISYIKAQRKLQLLEKQIAVDNERIRISADMHDEIGNGLTHIALLSELIQTGHRPGADIKKDIFAISNSARRLVQTMSEIIWALSPHNDTLENLLAYIREQSQEYFEGMNVNFTIHFPEVFPGIKLTNEERRNLFLVTREALANAMKHAHANCIHLSLAITTDKYCFQVRDDGVGIPANKSKVGSNGLRNMKKRIEDIGGSIEWVNEERGTSVNYCLNLSRH